MSAECRRGRSGSARNRPRDRCARTADQSLPSGTDTGDSSSHGEAFPDAALAKPEDRPQERSVTMLFWIPASYA